MVFLDTDFHNARLPAADYRVRPPYLSFHADIFRTQATPDLHLTGAIFQTGYPLPDLPRQTDSTDADSIMASQHQWTDFDVQGLNNHIDLFYMME